MKVNKEIRTQIQIAVLSLLTPLLSFFFATDMTWAERLVYLLTVACGYGFMLSIVSKRTVAWLAMGLQPFLLIDLIYLIMARRTPSLMWLFTIYVSEPDELRALIGTAWMIVMLLLSLWGYLLMSIQKKISTEMALTPAIRRWMHYICGTWVIIAVVGGTLYYRFDKCPAFASVLKVTPLADIYQTVRIVYTLHEIESGQQTLDNYAHDAVTTAEDDELIVLVIGEASRYRNWQLNGYARETTPNLVARRDELLPYDSCYGVANLTTLAVPLMLSPATPGETRRFIEEPALLSVFGAAGYETAWIADQSYRNQFLFYINSRCDYISYLPVNSYDVQLVDTVRHYLSEKHGKQLLVVHSIGSHYQYTDRYPKERTYFRPDMRYSSVNFRMRETLINSYDNTLRATDLFLDQLIRLLSESQRPVVMVYSSDHGENLVDTREMKVLHGQESSSIYEYHVPFFVWASPDYKERYPEYWQQLQAHRCERISTMNIFHTMLHLGHVTTRSLNEQMAISSEQFAGDTTSYRLDADLHCCTLDITEPQVNQREDYSLLPEKTLKKIFKN